MQKKILELFKSHKMKVVIVLKIDFDPRSGWTCHFWAFKERPPLKPESLLLETSTDLAYRW